MTSNYPLEKRYIKFRYVFKKNLRESNVMFSKTQVKLNFTVEINYYGFSIFIIG